MRVLPFSTTYASLTCGAITTFVFTMAPFNATPMSDESYFAPAGVVIAASVRVSDFRERIDPLSSSVPVHSAVRVELATSNVAVDHPWMPFEPLTATSQPPEIVVLPFARQRPMALSLVTVSLPVPLMSKSTLTKRMPCPFVVFNVLVPESSMV